MENRIKNTKADDKLKNEQLDAATEWLLTLNQDDVEESILNNFKSWLTQDKDNPKYFKEILHVWQLSALIAPQSLENIEHLLFEPQKP